MHHIKFLDKNGDQSLGPVHSTDEASKIGIMVGYMIPIIPSSVINCCRYYAVLPLKI